MKSNDIDITEIFKDQERMAKTVYVEREYIVINVVTEYRINLKRCNTYEKILGWLLHLSEKTWMTVEVMSYFIVIACEENQIDIQRKI